MQTTSLRDANDLRQVQGARLAAELRWAVRGEFARRQIGSLPEDLSPGNAMDVLAGCDFSDKPTYMRAIDDGEVLISAVPLAREFWTSGTSGKGREHVALGPVEDSTFLYTHVIQMKEAGLKRGDRLGLTWPSGPQAGGVVLREAAEMLGVIPLELGVLETEQKVEYILRAGVTAVVGSALYLRKMLDVGGDELVKALDVLLIAGEHYPAEWADTMASLDLRVFEWYGSTQTGACATSCRRGVVSGGERGMLHMPPHLYVAEVLGEDGNHVAVGERGELVITGLGRYATPLIRYRSRDEVRWLGWDICSGCGREWPSIECGTIERVDDMVRIRGVNVWPSAIEGVLGRWPEILDYRGRLWTDEHGNEHADLSLEMLGDINPSSELAREVTETVRREVGVRFDITLLEGPVQTAEFKQRRFSDERFR